jgi:hypothetical protein
VRTLINLQNIPTGFNAQNVTLFKVDTTLTGYSEAQRASAMREVEEKVKTIPGVQARAFSFVVFNQGGWSGPVSIHDYAPPPGQSRTVRNNVVGPDYFNAMGIPLLLGRGFGAQDTGTSQKVAVISETTAQRFFPNGSPLGRRFGRGGPENSNQIEVIGVVKDVKYGSLTEQPQPIVYYSYTQHRNFQQLCRALLRRAGSHRPASATSDQASQPQPADDEVLSLSDHIGRSLVQQRLVARLASFFGLLALLLACVGCTAVVLRRSTAHPWKLGFGWRSARRAGMCSAWCCAKLSRWR